MPDGDRLGSIAAVRVVARKYYRYWKTIFEGMLRYCNRDKQGRQKAGDDQQPKTTGPVADHKGN
jgi:hypothetical protein